MNNSFQLEIVTIESKIFSGLAKKLFVTGEQGELEILYNHAPLLTSITPGPVWFKTDTGKEKGLVVFGGMMEVQPKLTTILADTALRAEDLDEAAAEVAKQNIEKAIAQRDANFDYAKARTELAMAIAQLRLIRKIRDQLK